MIMIAKKCKIENKNAKVWIIQVCGLPNFCLSSKVVYKEVRHPGGTSRARGQPILSQHSSNLSRLGPPEGTILVLNYVSNKLLHFKNQSQVL